MHRKKNYRSFLLSLMLIILLFFSLAGDAAELVKKQDIVEVEHYIVKSADTLWSIAGKYDISLSNLKKFNQLENDIIKLGLELKIPHFKTLFLIRVEEKDTLWSISQTYNTTVENLKKFNALPDNTIYPGQHLVNIKENTDIFYLESELPTREEVFVCWKENYWIIEALTNLAQDDEIKDHVQKEMAQKDNISRMELAVILEQIVHELQEGKLQEDDSFVEIGSQEEAIVEVDNQEGDAEEVSAADVAGKLNTEESEKLERLIKFLEQELTEMNVKVEFLNTRTESLDNKAELLDSKTQHLDNKVKEVETDVEDVDKKIEVIDGELQQEKQITNQTTQFKLEGLTGVEIQTSELGTFSEKRLEQIILFNLHSRLSKTKEIDFFLQALYDHYTEGRTEILIGTSGKFGNSKDNFLSVDFAHQQPFNANIGYKQTYFGLGWSLYNPYIEIEALSGNSNTKDGQNNLTSLDTMLKGKKIKLNFKYKYRDPGFVPISTGEKEVTPERYYPGESFLTFSERRISGTLIYSLTDIFAVKAGWLKDDDYTAKDLGFNIQNNHWDWRNDYIIWNEHSPRDVSYWSSLGYILDPVEVKLKYDYTKMGDQDYTIVRTIGKLDLTNNTAINIEYNVIDQISNSSILGIVYRF